MAPKRAPPPPSQVPPSVADPSHGQTSASSAPTRPTPSTPSKPTAAGKAGGAGAAPNTPNTSSTPSSKTSSSSSSSSSNSFRNAQYAQQILQGVWDRYVRDTPQRVKLIDVFMAFLVVVGVLQFVYCVIAGNYVCPPLHSLSLSLYLSFCFSCWRQASSSFFRWRLESS